MSTDEYSEDIPEELYMNRTPSAASTSYPNIGSSSSCSLPMSGNVDISGIQIPHSQMLQNQSQAPMARQKRKYTRRKQPEERKKRGPRTKDMNAPRMPLNGYVRFLNANRERVKQENPELTFAEVTKRLASQWSSMTSDEKKAYLDEAERAKEMYLKELHEYQQTESYQEFMEMKQRVKQQHQPVPPSHIQQPQTMHASQMYQESQVPCYGQQAMCQPMHPSQYSSLYQHQSVQQPYSAYDMNGSSKFSNCMPTTNGAASNSYPQYYSNSHHSMGISSYGDPESMMSYQQRQHVPYPNMMPNSGLNGMSGYEHQQMMPSTPNAMEPNESMVGNAPVPNSNSLSSILDKCNSVVDLPIFTEEFLEHNKMREQDLRNLRTFTMEYEEANAISSKHIEDMVLASDRLAHEEEKEKVSNGKLKDVLDKLQQTLVEHFQSVVLPHNQVQSFATGEESSSSSGNIGPPTIDTIDQFMDDLSRFRLNLGPNGEATCKSAEPLVQSIQKAITSLDEITF